MRRFKNLLDQVGHNKHEEKPTQNEAEAANIMPQIKQPVRKLFINPAAHQEIMDSIADIYYSNKGDTQMYELQRLPDNPTQELINEMRKKLMDQLSAVSKKLSEIILKHQPAYYKELQKVRELEGDLNGAYLLCTTERECLDLVSTKICLKLLLNYRKRNNLLKLHNALTTIKTLEQTDVKLRNMVESENYPEAIQLCLECQKVVCTYRHYNSVTDLSTKLQDTLELIEEQIDVALSKICGNFEEDVYAKLQYSYFLLGKTQTAMDQLLMHFTTCIHNIAFQVVLGFAKLCTSQEKVNLHKKQFDKLCLHVNHDDKSIFIGCLLALCKSLWKIMNYYDKISEWHFKNFDQGSVGFYELTDFDKKYINQKLVHGRQRVWLDVQSRVKAFLMGTDLSYFKYDDFILALDIVKRLMQIGEDFINTKHGNIQPSNPSKFQSLHEPIQKQSLRYFKEHHRRCMDELKMFLENEAWEPCPMKSNFTITQLAEFKFLRIKNVSKSNKSHKHKPSRSLKAISFVSSTDTTASSEDNNPFFDFESTEKNSADMSYDLEEEISDDDETSHELYGEYIDEVAENGQDANKFSKQAKDSHLSGPLLTNAALNILRTCGKYMKMCDVLTPITFDVIACMTQLFDYYLYFIFSSFSENSPEQISISQKLSVTLQRIRSELIAKPTVSNGQQIDGFNGAGTTPNTGSENIKMEAPVCHMLNLNDRSNIYGLYQRVMATESLHNVAKQFTLLLSHLESIIPAEKQAFLQQFYSQTVNSCDEVRFLVFYPVAKKFINYDSILHQIGMVKWDIHEILSQHSAYVDILLRELETLQRSMPLVLKGIELSEDVNGFIWRHCLNLINKTIVEGYSNVKKCSNEGRALMQLDFQQFLGKAEKLTSLKPIPGKDFVEAYIKAYYMTEEDLETWIQKHIEYSHKQLTSLVNCNASTGGSSSKRNKQKLFSLIEDITKRR